MKTHKKTPIAIDGSSLTVEKLCAIAQGADLFLPEALQAPIKKSQMFVEKVAKGSKAVYGVNTGFGYFANQRISPEDLENLQSNLLKSHAGGFGTPLSQEETRLAMALRLHVLVKGYTGVRYELCEALLKLIQAEIYPIIPEYGSVGASGDLAPLAHLALPLIGEGLVSYKGKVVSAKTALQEAKLKPIKLGVKEGLGLINGTQIMLAVGGLALAIAEKLLDITDRIAALTFEALTGNINALHPLIHSVRPHQGQKTSAQKILQELEGSYLTNPTLERRRVQDPYSLRCAPQVHGTSRDAIAYAVHAVTIELNSATDNPLVFADEDLILSGGNFHGQPLAFAFDIAAMAISELGNISERRLEQLLNPHLSGLPAFLSPEEGLHSGYMITQYLSASLVNANKNYANPACTDSIPGNVGVEDHVSMGMTSARKFKQIVQNTKAILAAELISAAQAIDLRKNLALGKGTKKTYKALRKDVPFLDKDRIISEDVEKAVVVIENLLKDG